MNIREQLANDTKDEFECKLNSGDPYVICDLLESSKGSFQGRNYMRQLEDAIIETGDLVQIYEFMFMAVDMGIESFDRKRFEKIIQDSGNAKFMCYSIGFVPGIDIEEMLSKLYATNNARYIEELSSEEYSQTNIRDKDNEYDKKLNAAKAFDYFPKSLIDFEYQKDKIE